jgi:hypothetical protein
VADLVTHAAAAVLVKRSTGATLLPFFVAGTLVPDVLSRGPALALGWVQVHGMPLPPVATLAWEPMHQPVGMLILAYLLCMLTPAPIRASVFWNLVGGMALHLGLDSLQNHHGVGYMLAFPFSTWGFEFAAIGSEATVWVAPLLAVLAWRFRRRT